MLQSSNGTCEIRGRTGIAVEGRAWNMFQELKEIGICENKAGKLAEISKGRTNSFHLAPPLARPIHDKQTGKQIAVFIEFLCMIGR